MVLSVEALLKPVIHCPEIIITPVHTIAVESFQMLRTTVEIGEQIEEIRQLFLLQVYKIIGVRTDKTFDEVSLVQ